MTSPHVAAILLAAGRSTRMGAGESKPFLQLGGRTVLEHSLEAYAAAPSVDEIVVVAGEGDMGQVERLAAPYGAKLIVGGAERTDSV